MTPYEQFKKNIDAANHYRTMYVELRKLKKLGARGALDEQNRYLLWLPRAAVVSSVAALDAYVHQTLYLRIPQVLEDENAPLPDALAELIVRVAPIKNAGTARDALKYIRASDGIRLLAQTIKDKTLVFEAYQAPDKVVDAFRVIGVHDILKEVADRWQGPNTSREDIASRLAGYAKRRNQIAHESDLDTHHRPRDISPDYAYRCSDFMTNIVDRMNQAVFPSEATQAK
jgi:hypothetical protein